jgi:6-phosphofructokinase 1
MVLEVMGRYAGWVALFTAIGGGADWVLLPEEEIDIDLMCEHLKRVYERKKVATVVVSEGIEIPRKKIGEEKLDQFGHILLKERGVGEEIAEIIQDRLGIDTRASVIGHMQRGGAPTLFDRMLGVRAGVKAIELVKEGKFGQMVSLRGTEMVGISLEEAVGKLKSVSREWIDFAHTLFK